MSTFLDPKAVILGLTARKIRECLSKMGDDDFVVNRLSYRLGASWAESLSTLNQFWAHGLVELCETPSYPRGVVNLTDAGRGISAASFTKRISRARANELLENLLQRASQINSTIGKPGESPLAVSKIWIYGSFLDENRDELGDIDLVIETTRTDSFGLDQFKMIDYLHQNFPGTLTDRYFPRHHFVDVAEKFLQTYIFQGRRHPAFAPNYLHSLIELHAPCRLVFDLSRGGKVNDATLPHHPESKGRSAHCYERAYIPDVEMFGDRHFLVSSTLVSILAGRLGLPDGAKIDHLGADGFRIRIGDESASILRSTEELSDRTVVRYEIAAHAPPTWRIQLYEAVGLLLAAEIHGLLSVKAQRGAHFSFDVLFSAFGSPEMRLCDSGRLNIDLLRDLGRTDADLLEAAEQSSPTVR